MTEPETRTCKYFVGRWRKMGDPSKWEYYRVYKHKNISSDAEIIWEGDNYKTAQEKANEANRNVKESQ